MRGEVLEELTVATEEFWIPNFADKPGAFPNPCFKISGSPNFHIHIYQEGKGEMNKKKAPNSFHSIKPLNHVKEIRSGWVAAKT